MTKTCTMCGDRIKSGGHLSVPQAGDIGEAWYCKPCWEQVDYDELPATSRDPKAARKATRRKETRHCNPKITSVVLVRDITPPVGRMIVTGELPGPWATAAEAVDQVLHEGQSYRVVGHVLYAQAVDYQD